MRNSVGLLHVLPGFKFSGVNIAAISVAKMMQQILNNPFQIFVAIESRYSVDFIKYIKIILKECVILDTNSASDLIPNQLCLFLHSTDIAHLIYASKKLMQILRVKNRSFPSAVIVHHGFSRASGLHKLIVWSDYVMKNAVLPKLLPKLVNQYSFLAYSKYSARQLSSDVNVQVIPIPLLLSQNEVIGSLPIILQKKEALLEYCRNNNIISVMTIGGGVHKRLWLLRDILDILSRKLECKVRLYYVSKGYRFPSKPKNFVYVTQLHNVPHIPGLKNYYLNSLLYIQASEWETFSLPIIESFAHGTPALCPTEAGMQSDHIIASGAGELYTSPEEVVDAVKHIIHDYFEYARRAIIYSARYCYDAPEMLRVYSILAQKMDLIRA